MNLFGAQIRRAKKRFLNQISFHYNYSSFGKLITWAVGYSAIGASIVWIFKVNDMRIIAGLLGFLITTFLSIHKQSIDNDTVFRELFESFNSRYSNKINDLFNRLRENEFQLSSENKLLIIDYFNLCSEEFLWYKKGRIPKGIWLAWESGIIHNLSIPQVKKLFEKETKEERQRISYYGFAEHITPKL